MNKISWTECTERKYYVLNKYLDKQIKLYCLKWARLDTLPTIQQHTKLCNSQQSNIKPCLSDICSVDLVKLAMLSSNVNLNINKLMLRLRLPLSAIITNIVSYPTDFSPTPLITSMLKCLMAVLYAIIDHLSKIWEFFHLYLR